MMVGFSVDEINAIHFKKADRWFTGTPVYRNTPRNVRVDQEYLADQGQPVNHFE
jgi:hypothetical protein